jgi:ornithine cyclodeaminase
MLYLHEVDIAALNMKWRELVDVVGKTVALLGDGRAVQPLKPYLRYGDRNNRIIAMPAYVGGETDMAGIKWIASFPGNLQRGLPRAHSVIVLNDSRTGVPVAVIKGALLSAIRTASVSGFVLSHYLPHCRQERVNLAIIGWGPVGRQHCRMCAELFAERIGQIFLYDIRGIDGETIPGVCRHKTVAARSWQEAYRSADVVVTCTVAQERYIDIRPNPGALLLNVSLRDYKLAAMDPEDLIIVDNWDEVCRENTDIELLSKEKGVRQEHAHPLTELPRQHLFAQKSREQTVFFHPMGLAAFDIAVAAYALKQAESKGIGLRLP